MDKIRSIGLSLLVFAGIGCASSEKNLSVCRFRQSLPSMGSFFQLSVQQPCDRSSSKDIFVKVQQRLDGIEQQFSLYIQNSDLSRWNRNQRNFKIGKDFKFLVQVSTDLKLKSHGYFDVAALKQKGVPMTFDGIAKGYAVDEIAKLLASHGINDYRINFSGNLKWNSPQAKGAAASSGNKHRPGHIINPKTMRANFEIQEALVQGPSAMICDALSTAYFAAPPEGRAQIEKNYSNYSFSMGD